MPSDSLAAVGTFDQEFGRVALFGPDEAGLVAEWLGVADVPVTELLAGGSRFEMKRALATWRASGDPKLRAQADLYERTYLRR